MEIVVLELNEVFSAPALETSSLYKDQLEFQFEFALEPEKIVVKQPRCQHCKKPLEEVACSSKCLLEWSDRKGSNKIPMPPKEEILKQLEGRTKGEVARLYGVSYKTFYRWLGCYGLLRKFKKPSKEILRKDKEELSWREMSAKYGAPINTVLKWG